MNLLDAILFVFAIAALFIVLGIAYFDIKALKKTLRRRR